jgi:hypothetical protein
VDRNVASTMNGGVDTIRPKRCLDLTIRELDGEMVILDRQAGLVHQLNRTASCIWEACDGSATPAELAEVVARTFEVDVNTVADDVAAAVAQLLKLSLLKAHA